MIGLDFRSPVRVVCLKALPDKRFSVTHCEVMDNLAQYTLDVSLLINIALPDIQILNQIVIQGDKSVANMAWDSRDELSVMTTMEKRDKILDQFPRHHLKIHALDIESEAIARALRILCDVSNQYMGILNYDHHKLYLSVFKNDYKIFFHQENILSHSQKNNLTSITTRAFKLFEARYPDIQLLPSQCYIVGEYADKMKKWGITPNLIQKLNFELDSHREKFNNDSTQWLLACGLSLWDKKSSWNLMPWRESDKSKERTILFKQILKAMLYGLGSVILAHVLILLALHFQDEHNSFLDEKILTLNTKAGTVNLAEQEINVLQLHIKSLKEFSDDQLVFIRFLNNLSQSMPDGVFLNALTVEQQKASIAGRAETEAQINTLLDALKHHANIIDPILKNISQDESNPPYHFDFEIEMELN